MGTLAEAEFQGSICHFLSATGITAKAAKQRGERMNGRQVVLFVLFPFPWLFIKEWGHGAG